MLPTFKKKILQNSGLDSFQSKSNYNFSFIIKTSSTVYLILAQTKQQQEFLEKIRSKTAVHMYVTGILEIFILLESDVSCVCGNIKALSLFLFCFLLLPKFSVITQRVFAGSESKETSREQIICGMVIGTTHGMKSKWNLPAHASFNDTFVQGHYTLCRAKPLGRTLPGNLGFIHKNKTSGHSIFIAKNLLLDKLFFHQGGLLGLIHASFYPILRRQFSSSNYYTH